VGHLEDLLAVGVGRKARVQARRRPGERDHQPPLVDRELLGAPGKEEQEERQGGIPAEGASARRLHPVGLSHTTGPEILMDSVRLRIPRLFAAKRVV
jgi:hypothetical protein